MRAHKVQASVITISILTALLGAYPAKADLESGLIAWWRMDLKQGDTIPDASGNGHTFTILGSPTFEGTIVTFNDDGNLVADDSDDLDLLGDWSTSYWAREDSRDHPAGNPSNGWLGKVRNYGDAEGGWFLNSSDNERVRASIYGSPNCSHDTEGPLSLGSWYRITSTYEAANNTLRIYLNDSLMHETVGVACSMLANVHPVCMGGYLDTDGQSIVPYCKGAMADVRIYERVLSSSEVVDLSTTGCSSGVIWQHRSDSGPSPRRTMRLAYDGARGVTVLFGGKSDSTYRNDTWEWDGAAWAERCQQAEACGPEVPSPREDYGMAFDSNRGVVVVFGGFDGSFLGDTWEWDGSVWTKVDEGDPAGLTAPAPRGGVGMVYDTSRGTVVLYGGLRGLSPADHFEDMWQWDGTSWTQFCQTPGECGPVSPGARAWFGMTYDAVRGVVVLFGGHVGAGMATLRDTWEWDGAWTQRCVTCPPPNGIWPEMAYDASRQVSVRFGGWTGTALEETWEWDGVNWVQNIDPGPPGRSDHGMTYDTDRGVVVLFGGTDAGHLGDTWEYGSDCNENCSLDALEITAGASDCDSNNVLDACESDSDGDGAIDGCDPCPLDPGDDQDGDGVCADADSCSASIVGGNIEIGDCDTGVANLLLEGGCTMADLIGECAEDAETHGDFVSCVTHLCKQWKSAGLISRSQVGAIVSCAAQADIP